MLAKIHITFKNGVLDPQGKAVQTGLHALGFDEVDGVRQGKVFEVDLLHQDYTQAKERLDGMCKKLLANTVIEDFSFDIEEDYPITWENI